MRTIQEGLGDPVLDFPTARVAEGVCRGLYLMEKCAEHRSSRHKTWHQLRAQKLVTTTTDEADKNSPDSDRAPRKSLGDSHADPCQKLKQREIAGILGIAQSDVSHLMNGHFNRFTTDKLLDFLRRLGRKVTIEVNPHHKGEPYQEVTFVP
jgi:hypothetical protein